MRPFKPVITGVGAVTCFGIGKDIFWKNIEAGKSCLRPSRRYGHECLAGSVSDELILENLGQKGLRNIDRSALMLLSAAGLAIADAGLLITDANTDRIGVSTGTTFSHLQPILEFDKEVFKEGINFTSPALFPSTVLNAASSQVSIRYNIQGFNTTISTGFTSSLEAVGYSLNSLETGNADIVFSGGVETLSRPLLFGLKKLGYMAGLKGPAVSCPFDSRRNGPVPGEGAGMLCLESESSSRKRKARAYARILSVSSSFDPRGVAKVYPRGDSLEKAISDAISESGIKPGDIDYISSCANSTVELDSMEVRVLKRIFGNKLPKIPVSSIKSVMGETFSAAGILQVISCIGAMLHGVIPPTINYKKPDVNCQIDCVPNISRKNKIDVALVVSSGPGGYNSACILERT